MCAPATKNKGLEPNAADTGRLMLGHVSTLRGKGNKVTNPRQCVDRTIWLADASVFLWLTVIMTRKI